MKLANQNQISELERLLLQIRQSSQPSQARGYFTHAEQILGEINYLSTFKGNLTMRLIGADTIQKLHEPTEILKNAIEYYKKQLVNPPPPKKQEPTSKITQPQNKIDLEKQKALSENALLKQVEENRLKLWGNLLFMLLAFFIPFVCGIYFIVALFKFKTMNLADPTTWIDRDKFGDLEFLIILFEFVVIGACGWIYKRHKSNFVSWFYERQRTKLN